MWFWWLKCLFFPVNQESLAVICAGFDFIPPPQNPLPISPFSLPATSLTPSRFLTWPRTFTSRTSTVWAPCASCTSESSPTPCSPTSSTRSSLWVWGKCGALPPSVGLQLVEQRNPGSWTCLPHTSLSVCSASLGVFRAIRRVCHQNCQPDTVLPTLLIPPFCSRRGWQCPGVWGAFLCPL